MIKNTAKTLHHVINFGNYILDQTRSVEFIKNVRSTFGTRILVAFCSATVGVLVARFLGPAGKGQYSVAITLGMMGVYLSLLGLNASNTHFVAKRRDLLPHLISNNILFSLIVGVLSLMAIGLVRHFFPKLILIDSPLLWAFSVLWIPLSLANILFQSLLIGIENIRKFNTVELLTAAAGPLGIGIMIPCNRISVENFFFCSLIGQILGLALGVYYVKPFIKNLVANLSWKLLKETLWHGLRVLYLTSIFFFLLLSVDLLIIKYYLGEKQAGYYSVAMALANLLLLLPGVIGTLLFAKLSAIPEAEMRWHYTLKVIKWSVAMMLVLLIIFVFLAKPLILLFFGQAFHPSIIVFVWLTPAIFFASIAIIYLNYFSAEGMWMISTFSTAATSAINIILNLKMIPLVGILGASYAANISHGILMMILILYIFSRKQRIGNKGDTFIKHSPSKESVL